MVDSIRGSSRSGRESLSLGREVSSKGLDKTPSVNHGDSSLRSSRVEGSPESCIIVRGLNYFISQVTKGLSKTANSVIYFFREWLPQRFRRDHSLTEKTTELSKSEDPKREDSASRLESKNDKNSKREDSASRLESKNDKNSKREDSASRLESENDKNSKREDTASRLESENDKNSKREDTASRLESKHDKSSTREDSVSRSEVEDDKSFTKDRIQTSLSNLEEKKGQDSKLEDSSSSAESEAEAKEDNISKSYEEEGEGIDVNGDRASPDDVSLSALLTSLTAISNPVLSKEEPPVEIPLSLEESTERLKEAIQAMVTLNISLPEIETRQRELVGQIENRVGLALSDRIPETNSLSAVKNLFDDFVSQYGHNGGDIFGSDLLGASVTNTMFISGLNKKFDNIDQLARTRQHLIQCFCQWLVCFGSSANPLIIEMKKLQIESILKAFIEQTEEIAPTHPLGFLDQPVLPKQKLREQRKQLVLKNLGAIGIKAGVEDFCHRVKQIQISLEELNKEVLHQETLASIISVNTLGDTSGNSSRKEKLLEVNVILLEIGKCFGLDLAESPHIYIEGINDQEHQTWLHRNSLVK